MFDDNNKNDKKLSCLMLNILLVSMVIILSSEATSIDNSRQSLNSSLKSRNSELGVKALLNDHTHRQRKVIYDENKLVPELPKIKVFNKEQLEVGQELSVGCISRNGFPPAQIFWDFDAQLLDSFYQFEETFQDGEGTSVVSVMQWNLTTEDNNRNLICKARHSGYNEGLAIAVHKLAIYFKPMDLPARVFYGFKIGDPVDVSILFQSNPKPSSLIWFVGNKKIYYGTQTSKYISKEIAAEPNSFWNASLNIKNLTVEDTQLNYTLRVKNSLGFAKYYFEIKEEDPEELTTTQDNIEFTTSSVEVLDETENDSSLLKQGFQKEELLAKQMTFDDQSQEPISIESIEVTTFSVKEMTPSSNESDVLKSSHEEIKTEILESKTKVSRVMIYKRPLLKNGTRSTNDTSHPVGFNSNLVKIFFVDSASKAIIFWKSSLMLLVIGLLIASLFYYRRRINILKAKIVEKNLGNAHNRSSTFNQSANAYTPTYFSQSVRSSERVKNLNRPRQCEPTCSSSVLYSPTYNSSLHSYVSIDALTNDHIYDEIPSRKLSVASSHNKENDNDDESITSHLSDERLNYVESFRPNTLQNHHALVIWGHETHRIKDFTDEIESTYI